MSKPTFAERPNPFDNVHESGMNTRLADKRTQFYLGFNEGNAVGSAELARQHTILTDLEGNPIEPSEGLRERLEFEGRTV